MQEGPKGTVYMMGGLGDGPTMSDEWRTTYEAHGYEFVDLTPDTAQLEDDWKFDDRVQGLVRAVTTRVEHDPNHKIVLIGQSAGGLAVLKAATELEDKVEEVVSVSPAMPDGINPLSLPLLSVMWKYAGGLLAQSMIYPSKGDHAYVSSPGVEDWRLEELAETSTPIVGGEGASLAGFPFGKQPDLDLTKIKAKVFMLTGGEDRWVNPKAHTRLAQMLAETLPEGNFMWLRIPGVGHMPAQSTSHIDLSTTERVAKVTEDPHLWARRAELLRAILFRKRS